MNRPLGNQLLRRCITATPVLRGGGGSGRNGLAGVRQQGRRWAAALLSILLMGAVAPPGAGAQSDGTDAPVFAVALGSSLADVGAATLLVAAGQADAVLMVDTPDMAGATATSLVGKHGASAFVLVGGSAALGSEIETDLAALAPGAAMSRLWGAGREATAAEVARQVLDVCPDPRGAVVALANGWSAADAAAAAAAVATGSVDVVLWTSAGKLGDAATEALKEFSVRRVLVVGGPAALSEQIVDTASAAAGPTAQIRRVGGADRADTAVMVARVATAGRAAAAVIADGWDLHAAAQAAALAAAASDAVVLFSSPGGTLGDAAAQFLADSKPERIWALSSDEVTRDALAQNAEQAASEARVNKIDSPAAATAAAIQVSRQQDSQAGGCIDAGDSAGVGSSGSGGGSTSGGDGGTRARNPIPPNPTGVDASPQGPNTVLVTWDRYPTGHSVIELTVAWNPAVHPPTGMVTTAFVGLSDTQYTVTGLTPGVEYQFTVFARNSYGERRGTATFATTPTS